MGFVGWLKDTARLLAYFSGGILLMLLGASFFITGGKSGNEPIIYIGYIPFIAGFLLVAYVFYGWRHYGGDRYRERY